MPLYEHVCLNESCSNFRQIRENYFPRMDSPVPNCECGQVTRRVISRANITWTKPFGEYGDPNKEYYNPAGHVAYRVRSSRRADGQPEKVFIDSHAKQREYCREEGLHMPDDVGPMEIGSDGRSYSSNGLPGCWV